MLQPCTVLRLETTFFNKMYSSSVDSVRNTKPLFKVVFFSSFATELYVTQFIVSITMGWPFTSFTLHTLCPRLQRASDARQRSKKARKFHRRIGRYWDICKSPKFTVGFFLRRRSLQVENNNKFSHQFLQVTFAMLQMFEVRISLNSYKSKHILAPGQVKSQE